MVDTNNAEHAFGCHLVTHEDDGWSKVIRSGAGTAPRRPLPTIGDALMASKGFRILMNEDGSTVRGRPFGQPLVGLGESVLWKQPDKGPGHDVEGNSGPRMLDGGIFLGYSRLSNTYQIGTDNGVEEVRGVSRKPAPNRWDEERLSGLQATPWDTRVKHGSEVVFQEPAPQEAGPPEREVLPRQFRITKNDVQTYGYTEGCVQCDLDHETWPAQTGNAALRPVPL